MHRGWVSLLCVLILPILSGCASDATTQSGAVGVDRRQTLWISSEEIDKSANQQYDQIIAEARKKGQLNSNAQEAQRVKRIVKRLIPATVAFRSDAVKWDWEANVIDSKELNAWCMPGGKIAVYSGLIEQLKLSDAELAAVLGHEIAHALREHARERISQQMATNAVVGIGAAILGVGDAGASLGQAVMNVTFTLPNSRTQESEADAIGVELAARAGYDPNGAVSVWQKMLAADSSAPPQFLSTHPSSENRIKELKVHAQQVMPLYRAAKK